MSILLELISCTVSCAAGYSVPKFRKKKIEAQVCIFNSIPWSWENGTPTNGYAQGFRCFKCRALPRNNMQMPHCSCYEFPRGHYHFKCKECAFAAIMRTADDKEGIT